MEKSRTLNEWIKDKKEYIKDEKKGLLITGATLIGVTGSLLIASSFSKVDNNKQLVLTNQPKTITEEDNANDNNISFQESQDIRIYKYQGEENPYDINILFLKSMKDKNKKHYNIDILSDVIITNETLNRGNGQFLGCLQDYLIVNDNMKQNYTKEELRELKNLIKVKEISNNKKLTK